MSKIKKLATLFFTFMKIGCFTFGGGWSLIAQAQKEFVDKRKIITNEELLDIASVGKSIPGVMIGNTTMIFGYHEAGFLGGLACVTGMVIPPVIILIVITHFYTILAGNFWMEAVMKGIRAAVVPIMLSATYGLVKSGYKFPPCILVTVLTCALYLFFNVNCIYLVLIGVVFGIAISEYYERRERKDA